MSWYDTGTVAVTNGSTTVTGTGTNFLVGAQIGEGFYGPDERLYEIASITSATVLVLADGYLGSTQSGQDYKIVPTQSLVADLATQVSSLITDFADVRDEAGAGKFDDGVEATPGITFLQDQDTGFYRPTANELAIVTAASERVRVDDAGNVGVGISTPDSKFQVAAGATDRISLDVSGVVSTMKLGNVNTGAGNFIASYDRTTGILTTSIGPKGSENGAFSITSDGNITFDGNLGIGGATANANELVLAESAADTEASFLIRAGSTATSSLVDASLKLFARSSNNAQARSQITAIGTGGQASHLTFNTESGGSLTEKVRIESGGNVGIGDSSPSRKLSVRDVTATPFISIVGSTSSIPGLLFGDADSDAVGQIRYDNTNNSMTFTTANTVKMLIQADGNMLVGKTVKQTQTQGLDVQQLNSSDTDAALGLKSGTTSTTGNVFINCFLQSGVGSGRIEANGAQSLGFGTFSDIALKENIEDLPPQLDNVMQLRPVEFDYKDGSGHQIGFIAQEVEQVWPDLVSGEEGSKSIVGLGKTESRLIKALQEAVAKIDLLEARIATLEAN